MSALEPLEKSLQDIYKGAPALPASAIKVIVQYLPWVVGFIGLLTAWSAYVLYNWANTANGLVDLANELSATYGGAPVIEERLTAMVWVGIVVLVVEAIIYLAAFSPLKARKKLGWDLLFYALLINVVYGVVVMFTAYGGFGNLLGTVIGSAIGLYFLYQIRPSYVGKKSAPAKK